MEKERGRIEKTAKKIENRAKTDKKYGSADVGRKETGI